MIDDLEPMVASPSRDRDRLDLLALLVTAMVGAVVVTQVWSTHRQLRTFGRTADITEAFHHVPHTLGIAPSVALVVPFLLVVIGTPRPRTALVTWTLRLLVAVGLVVGLLWGYAGGDVLLHPTADVVGATFGSFGGGPVSALTNVLTVVPVLVGSVLACYLAWCAFQALGPTADPEAEDVAGFEPPLPPAETGIHPEA